jgi:3-oxoacyl-(acyl-carrier-protein) synthase
MALNNPRVVITGLGMVSSLGININESWNRLINGESGLRSIKSIPYIAENPNFPDVYMGLIPENFDKMKWTANVR